MILIIGFMLLAAAAFWASAIAAAAWAVQFTILNLTARRLRILRWVTLAVPALAACCLSPHHPFMGTILTGTLLLGWALAWFAYKVLWGGPEEPAEPHL